MKVIVTSKAHDFIIFLDPDTRTKIQKALETVEKFGWIPTPFSKQITKNLFEYKIRGRQEIRLFYCYHKSIIFVVHGFIKKSMKIPKHEIITAIYRRDMLTSI